MVARTAQECHGLAQHDYDQHLYDGWLWPHARTSAGFEACIPRNHRRYPANSSGGQGEPRACCHTAFHCSFFAWCLHSTSCLALALTLWLSFAVSVSHTHSLTHSLTHSFISFFLPFVCFFFYIFICSLSLSLPLPPFRDSFWLSLISFWALPFMLFPGSVVLQRMQRLHAASCSYASLFSCPLEECRCA